MILLDLNQTTFSALFALYNRKEELDVNLLRYIIFNCIRSYKTKYKNYGNLIVCSDGKDCWRKDIFPYYKLNRKLSREESPIDWEKIFTLFNSVREDLKQFFPYPVLHLDRIEADDIIAVLSDIIDEPILILSGDTDFVQLHSDKVSQYDPVRKKIIKIKQSPESYLKEHIIEGDSSDGIPNILLSDDALITKLPKKKLTKKRKDYFIKTGIEAYSTEHKRNYLRNKQLIDLSCIPESIKLDIRAKYISTPYKDNLKLFNYFYDNRLTKFIDVIQEF